MAGTSSSSSSNPSAAPPKILLTKPGLGPAGSTVGKFIRGGNGVDDDSVSIRSRLPSIGSLNLLSDSWEFHSDRILSFLTENTEFTVIGVIGPPGAGKSTILNEIYGFDGSSSGMLPPFAIQSEDIKAMARHCTVGIELRVSAERIILLDTQPIFSPSVLAEMVRPDGSSTISVLPDETLSADLALELMGIQVDLLKHGIPDPSLVTHSYAQGSSLGPEKESKDNLQEFVEEYMASPVFIHTKLRDHDLSPANIVKFSKAMTQYFRSSSFIGMICGNTTREHSSSQSPESKILDTDLLGLNLFMIPFKIQDDSQRAQYESYTTMLGKLRDRVLSMNYKPFAKTLSERDWLRNSARIWEIVKNSPVIAEYGRTLQNSGMFRR